MELEELIRELDNLIGEADLAADSGKQADAKEYLRKAKELIEEELLKD